MKLPAFAAAPLLVLASACTSTAGSLADSGPQYWRNMGASESEFPARSHSCSLKAVRLGKLDAKDAPTNRLDRPPQKWPNEVAQEVYEVCMRDWGWRAAD